LPKTTHFATRVSFAPEDVLQLFGDSLGNSIDDGPLTGVVTELAVAEAEKAGGDPAGFQDRANLLPQIWTPLTSAERIWPESVRAEAKANQLCDASRACRPYRIRERYAV
jgi:hypothetical protein